MRKQQNQNKNLVPLLFCSVLVLQQSLSSTVFASTITDGSGNPIAKDPIDSAAVGKDVFNLRPEAFNGKYGFRQFKDFNITEGDVVNFLYRALQLDVVGGVQQHKYFDIETFVNFINNADGAQIHGIINTMRELGDTSINNGNLVFISPNGLMVGSTGVLNVGSLQVYTPSQTAFDTMRSGLPDREINTSFSDGTTTALAQNVSNTFDPSNTALYTGSGAVTINGRVASRGDINLNGGQINVGNGGLLLAGVGNDSTYITTKGGADVLFGNLVNADNMNSANEFSSANGKIVIKANQGVDIGQNAKVRNYNSAANSSTTIENTGVNGIKIAGEVSNPNGTMTIKNSAGALNETSTGLIRNKGTLTVTNLGSGTGITLDGTVTNTGDMTVTNETGANGLNIGGNVTNNTGAAKILNKVNTLTVKNSGTVTSNGTSLEITNSGANNLAINGNVYNNAGTANITNTSASTNGSLDISGLVQNNGTAINVTNNGANGLHILTGGSVDNNTGVAKILNTANDLSVSGSVINDGTSVDITNSGAGGLNISGIVDNNKGVATVTNTNGALNVTSTGEVVNDGTSLTMENEGAGGFTVDGKVTNNKGIAKLLNKTNKFTINGTVSNSGSKLDIENQGVNGLSIAGQVLNKTGAGQATITNTSGSTTGGLDISGLVQNDGAGVTVNNSGANGLNISGTVDNNNGTAEINNYTDGLDVVAGGNVINDGDSLLMTNSGTDGFNVYGNITNNNGVAELSNTNNKLNIASTGVVSNSGDALDITNSGRNGLTIAGQVLNKTGAGAATITNTSASTNGGLTVSGLVQNKGASVTLNNAGNSGLNISGTVDNDNGTVSVLNSNGGLNVLAGGTVTNDGSELIMTNDGAGGFSIDGIVINNRGTATLTNNTNKFTVNSSGTVNNRGTRLTMTNSGANGMLVAGKVYNYAGDAVLTNTVGSSIGNFEISGLVQNDGNSLSVNNAGAGGLLISGLVDNNRGAVTVTNTNGALNVNSVGEVVNDGDSLKMQNDGNGGFIIDGKVTNNNGTAKLLNKTNKFTINGTVSNSGSTLDIENQGVNGLSIAGNVLNKTGAGLATITNTSSSTTGGLDISGLVQNNGAGLSVNNAGNGGLNVKSTGRIENYSGDLAVNNTNGALNVERADEAHSGIIKNSGKSMTVTNSGAGGINVAGVIQNENGTANINNTNAGLLVSSTGRVNSTGSALTVNNTGAGGMDIQGLVTHNNKDGIVNFINENSNMTIGHTSNEFNIDSNADVNITVKNGNLLNNGVAKTLIRTTEQADLITTVTDGSVGIEVGPCDGGVCTGVGPAERDLTKSINTEIDGTITIDNTGRGALVNLASLDKDMNVNKIHSDGRLILLADDKTNKGATPYSILNKSEDNLATPNLKGSGISAIASGNIGAGKSDKITFLQTGVNVDIANEDDDASQPHDLYETPLINGQPVGTEYVEGVEFLAIGDINAKGLDNADGTKADTKVCTISSREGSVNVEFSGNTYIRDITAQNEVNIVDRGSEMYIENLGAAPSRYAESGDYYGDYTGIVPEKATVKVLDMGTKDNPNLVPNSTLVIKNGTLNGQGSTSHPNLDQDLTVTADNAYVGGYYFNMGKHRMPGLSSVTPDDRTNPLVNTNPDTDKPVSIRGKAVRPDDVTETGEPEGVREYYYGYDPDKGETPDDDVSGSGQRDDETFDPDKEKADDLVVPEPKDPTPPGDDDDDDGPTPPPPGDDDDDDGPTPPPPGDDDDDDGPTPPPPGDDDDDDGPTPPPPGDDDDDGPTPPPPGDDDDGPDVPDKPDEPNVMGQTWKKEYNDYIEVIDKRQYMRFDTEANQNQVVFNSDSPSASGILNISRGGVQLSHNKSLKVGDVVPVHIKYGDVEVNTEVKVVSTTDRTAGAEFVDLDLATKNKILYLSLLKDQGELKEGQYYAEVVPKNDNLSTTGVDD